MPLVPVEKLPEGEYETQIVDLPRVIPVDELPPGEYETSVVGYNPAQPEAVIKEAPPPELNLLESALDAINRLGHRFGLDKDIFHIAKKEGISKAAKAQALIKYMAKQEGVPVHEYRVAPSMESVSQGFIEGFTGGVLPGAYEAVTGEKPWEDTSFKGETLRSLSSLGGMIAGAPGAVGKAAVRGTQKALPFLVPEITQKLGPRVAKAVVSEAINLAPFFASGELGKALEEKNVTDAAKSLLKAAESGALTGAVFGAVKGVFPENVKQRAARIISGLLTLNAQRALEDPKHAMPWKRSLPGLIRDTVMDVFFLWNGLGSKGLDEVENQLKALPPPKEGTEVKMPETPSPESPSSVPEGAIVGVPEAQAKTTEEQVSPEAVAEEQPPELPEIRTKSGKPFKTEAALKARLKKEGKYNDYERKQVDGGWIGVPREKIPTGIKTPPIEELALRRGIDIKQWQKEAEQQGEEWGQYLAKKRPEIVRQLQEKAAAKNQALQRLLKVQHEVPILQRAKSPVAEKIAKIRSDLEKINARLKEFGVLPKEIPTIEGKSTTPEERLLVRPQETFLEQATRRVGGTPGVREIVPAESIPKDKIIETPIETMGPREVIKSAEQEQEASKIHEGVPKPEVPEEGKVPPEEGGKGVRGGGQEEGKAKKKALTEDNLKNLTFNTIENYTETEGVGRHKGIKYRKAEYIALDSNGAERKYTVQVNDRGDIKITDHGKTKDQIEKERRQEWEKHPKELRDLIEKEWGDLKNLTQKNVIADIATGKKVDNLTLKAVIGGTGRETFQKLFPKVNTVKEAKVAIKRWADEALKKSKARKTVIGEPVPEGANIDYGDAGKEHIAKVVDQVNKEFPDYQVKFDGYGDATGYSFTPQKGPLEGVTIHFMEKPSVENVIRRIREQERKRGVRSTRITEEQIKKEYARYTSGAEVSNVLKKYLGGKPTKTKGKVISFIRFGPLPKASTNWQTNKPLGGISVYEINPETGAAKQTIRAEFAERPIAYVGEGKIIDFGPDGEPLVEVINIKKATPRDMEKAEYYGLTKDEFLDIIKGDKTKKIKKLTEKIKEKLNVEDVVGRIREQEQKRGVSKFKLTEKPTQEGIATNDIEQAISPLQKELNIGKIKIISSEEDVPKEVPSSEAERASGFVHKDTIYLNPKNIGSTEEAVKTVLHEAVGHYGLQKVLGKDYKKTLLSIGKSLNEKTLKPIADRYGYDLKSEEGLRNTAEEYVAGLAEKNKKVGVVKKVFAGIKNALRKLGLNIKWTDSDIYNLLQKSRYALQGKEGRTIAKIGEFAVAPRYSLKEAVRKITDNPNFKRWFGKSKVVDKKGNPLVVYHGTPYGNFYETAVRVNRIRDKILSRKEALEKEYMATYKKLFSSSSFLDEKLKVIRELGDELREKLKKGKISQKDYKAERSTLDDFLREPLAGDPTYRAYLKERKKYEALLDTISSKIKKLPLVPERRLEKDAFLHSFTGATDYGYLARGFYFTPDKKLAEDYATFGNRRKEPGEVKKPYIYEVYLKIEKPFTVGKDKISPEMAKVENEIYNDLIRTYGDKDIDVLLAARQIARTQMLKRFGYDGIIGEAPQGKGLEYVVFEPTQIKSIYNKGTFNPEEPDIRYRLFKDKEETKIPDDAKKVIIEAYKDNKTKAPLIDKPFLPEVDDPTVAKKAIEFLKKGRDSVWSLFTPELLAGEKGKEIEAKLGQAIVKEASANRIAYQALENKIKWWDQVPEKAGIDFMIAIEEPKIRDKILDHMVGGSTAVKKLLLDDMKLIREWFDQVHKAETNVGIAVNYRENYFTHMWDKPEKAREIFKQLKKSLGRDRYTKLREVEKIRYGLAQGLKLRTANPFRVVLLRVMNANRYIPRQELINYLIKDGTAIPAKGNKVMPDEFTVYSAPDGHDYYIPKSLDKLLENAKMVEGKGKGLWENETVAGSIFRAIMRAKNALIPIKLGFSAFHPVHIALIDFSARRAALIEKLIKEDNPDWQKAMKDIAAVSTGAHHYKAVKEGLRLQKIFKLPDSQLNSLEKQAKQYMIEGGFDPELSEEWKIKASANLERAIRNQTKLGRGFDYVANVLQAMQKPLFELWIPGLKASAYVNECRLLLERRPELINDPVERAKEFTKIKKSVDNRYGELQYKTLFWNKIVKDIGIGSMLSMGWQLGFTREFGGGAVDAAKFIKKAVKGEATKEDITRRMIFSVDYMVQSMLLGALITYLMTGEAPKKLLDYFYPRAGGKNPDGSIARFNTPNYTREFFALSEHMRKEGLISGPLHMLGNKANPFLSVVYHIARNKDYYDVQIRDLDSNTLEQIGQVMQYFLKESLPISYTSYQYGKERMGKKKAAIGSFLGFTPAPAYITQTVGQRMVFDEFDRKRGAGTKTKAESEREKVRRQMKREIRLEGKPSEETIKKAFDTKLLYGPKKMVMAQYKKIAKGAFLPGDISIFKSFDNREQLYLLEKMWKKGLTEDIKRYFRPKVTHAWAYHKFYKDHKDELKKLMKGGK